MYTALLLTEKGRDNGSELQKIMHIFDPVSTIFYTGGAIQGSLAVLGARVCKLAGYT